MDIAKAKRRENIAEYILYLWQVEDLLRALGFDPGQIRSALVEPRGLEPEKAQEYMDWYVSIGNMLREEGKESEGHLAHTLHLIADLHGLHNQLLTLPVGERYRPVFDRLSAELPRLREVLSSSERLSGSEMSDTELSFRALYAAMLYRMKGGEKETQIADGIVEVVSPSVAVLADIYGKAERGEIDLFEGTENDGPVN